VVRLGDIHTQPDTDRRAAQDGREHASPKAPKRRPIPSRHSIGALAQTGGVVPEQRRLVDGQSSRVQVAEPMRGSGRETGQGRCSGTTGGLTATVGRDIVRGAASFPSLEGGTLADRSDLAVQVDEGHAALLVLVMDIAADGRFDPDEVTAYCGQHRIQTARIGMLIVIRKWLVRFIRTGFSPRKEKESAAEWDDAEDVLAMAELAAA